MAPKFSYQKLIDHCVSKSSHSGDYYGQSIRFLYDLFEGPDKIKPENRFKLSDRQAAWLHRIEVEYNKAGRC